MNYHHHKKNSFAKFHLIVVTMQLHIFLVRRSVNAMTTKGVVTHSVICLHFRANAD